MAEALMITVFLGLLIILQIIDQKKIIVFAQSSPVRKSLSILLTVAILLIFWPEHLTDQISCFCFCHFDQWFFEGGSSKRFCC